MSTIGRQTSGTIVALLSTINGAATSVARVIDSGSSAVDMLDGFIQRAKIQQSETHLVEHQHWRRNLILDASRMQERKETELTKEYAGDAPRQLLFNKIASDLEALFVVKEA